MLTADKGMDPVQCHWVFLLAFVTNLQVADIAEVKNQIQQGMVLWPLLDAPSPAAAPGKINTRITLRASRRKLVITVQHFLLPLVPQHPKQLGKDIEEISMVVFAR